MRSRRKAAWSCVIRIRDTETRVEQNGRCLPDLSTHKERAQAWERPRVEDMRLFQEKLISLKRAHQSSAITIAVKSSITILEESGPSMS